MKGKIILLTGVSASGKSTMQELFIDKHNYSKPTNATTRPSRSDKELDEYVFYTPQQFTKQVLNWAFLEFTVYNKNFYWMVDFLSEVDKWKDYIVILEPVGRIQMESILAKKGYKYITVKLDISKETQSKRLEERLSSVNEIAERQKDFLYFDKIKYDYIIEEGSLEDVEKSLLQATELFNNNN